MIIVLLFNIDNSISKWRGQSYLYTYPVSAIHHHLSLMLLYLFFNKIQFISLYLYCSF